MDFKVKLRYSRISAFKARGIAELVRGKGVEEALMMLKFMPQKTTYLLERLIQSGVANAEQSEEPVSVEDLFIKEIFVDEGPTMKRIQFRAQGRVNKIRKRTSHITVTLGENKKK